MVKSLSVQGSSIHFFSINKILPLAKFLPVLLLFLLPAMFSAGSSIDHIDDSLKWNKIHFHSYDIFYTADDSGSVKVISRYVSNGEKSVREFFGHDYPHSFSVYIFPTRASLDKQWQHDWGDTSFHSECWMVASGVGARLDLLSTRIWNLEACDHSPADTQETQKLITHEMVHVFHGQQNPKPDFAGLDDLAWLIEGLATFASGQLDDRRLAGVKSLAGEGKAPTALSNFWTGKNKYGLAGSMMKYVDTSYGRKKLLELLPCTDQQRILSLLNTDEATLISHWKDFVLKQ